MNILLTLAFKGTAYHGFQVQQNAITICEELQKAMEKLFGARPDVKGCSRTDAGVHANEYCLNFHYDTNIPMRKMPLALNNYLPFDIRVKKAQLVPQEFHARYSSVGKQYRYIFLNSAIDDPLALGLYHRVSQYLDEQKMQTAGNYLLGKHDFSSFMSAGSDIEDTVRTIHKLQVTRQDQRVCIDVAADGFLYNMVRIIAGTLLKVGNGKIAPQTMQTILESQNRSFAGETMRPEGLFLQKVFYPEQALVMEDSLK